MKAALLTRSTHFSICEVSRPIPHKKEVLIKVVAVSISDLDVFKIASETIHNQSTIMGHRFSGVIAEVGSEVQAFKVNDRVTAIPFMPCGKCQDCRSGNHHWCEQGQTLGQHQDGAFAEYVVVPEANVLNINRLTFEEGALLEAVARAAHGIKKLRVEPEDCVAVFGLHSIGLLTVQWLRQMGVKQIIGLDTDLNNIQEAKKHGVTHTVNLLRESAEDLIFEWTLGAGVDISIETTGSVISEERCLLVTKKGGSIGYYGLAPSNMMLRQQAFKNIFQREYTLKGLGDAYSAPFPGSEWRESIALIEQKLIDPAALIARRFTLDAIQEAFDLAMTKDTVNWQLLVASTEECL
ncbi:alcohol dehydrogenase catalytic domain-containing protein [Enterococcus sp. AZ109]|uniref:alcohol dehydrogenase catalytic domain-containing protein n=1 Tax=Enterococcus sp. AZ109 TaxID=2774634 RepID=UPI003F286457